MTPIINVKYKCHLTKNYQDTEADKLISKLRTELGAANSYIEELEEKVKELEVANSAIITERDKYQSSLKELNDKYSRDVNNFVKTDPIYQKIQEKLKETKEENEKLHATNDSLYTLISKLRDERNNTAMV